LGRAKAQKIASFLAISPNAKVSELTSEHLYFLTNFFNILKVDYSLRVRIYRIIKRTGLIKTYKSFRKRWGLPCRGQRTLLMLRLRMRCVGLVECCHLR
jgi:ribosomal protein S13